MDERKDDSRRDAGENAEPYDLPVKVAAAAEANAPTRILPSSPMSTIPDRSDHKPARQARMSGMARRMPEANTTRKASNHSIMRQMGGWVVRRASRVATGRRNMCSSAPANSTTRP